MQESTKSIMAAFFHFYTDLYTSGVQYTQAEHLEYL